MAEPEKLEAKPGGFFYIVVPHGTDVEQVRAMVRSQTNYDSHFLFRHGPVGMYADLQHRGEVDACCPIQPVDDAVVDMHGLHPEGVPPPGFVAYYGSFKEAAEAAA